MVLGSLLLDTFVFDFGIQWACFVVAASLQTEKFYDLTGSLTFVGLGLFALIDQASYFTRQCVATGMMIGWAMRLGSFLFYRVLKDGKDRRFDKARTNPKQFFIFWTIQAMWVWITSVPVYILNDKTHRDPALGWRDYLGWIMWAFGFLLECAADWQKFKFRSDPNNRTMFIQHGVWSLSRHPNYFGEICCWCGLFLTSSSVFSSAAEWVSVLSPLFVVFLLTRVSGVPLLEKAADKRYGPESDSSDEIKTAYAQYVAATNVLIPWLPSKKRAGEGTQASLVPPASL